ncbi:MAG: HD domain-containing protein [Candidatus Kerfeldbacteria bacterium]|nr:HD domain-containing protein [Candidatus Kerfeldbacteria bacterium]
MNNKRFRAIANFIYEAGILSKTPRSGLWFLGTGRQTVAEHSLRTAMIGFALASMTTKADRNKVVLMCVFHDLGEGRTSDLNYVHQRYGRMAEAQAVKDISKSVEFGHEIAGFFREFEAQKTLEAKLAKDADNLEWIATLREEEEKGNRKAAAWAKSALKRLKTSVGRSVARFLMSTHPDAWWFKPGDRWFVDRKESYRRWRTDRG